MEQQHSEQQPRVIKRPSMDEKQVIIRQQLITISTSMDEKQLLNCPTPKHPKFHLPSLDAKQK